MFRAFSTLLISMLVTVAAGAGEIIHLSDYKGSATFDGPLPGPEIPVWPHLSGPGEMPDAPTISVVDGWQSHLDVLSISDHWLVNDDTPLLLRVSDIGTIWLDNLIVDAGRHCLWMDGTFEWIWITDSSFVTYEVGTVESLFRGPYHARGLAFMHCSFEHTKWKPVIRAYGLEEFVLLYDCDIVGGQLNFGGYDGPPCASSNPVGIVYLLGVDHDTTSTPGLLDAPLHVREADAVVLLDYDVVTQFPVLASIEEGIPIIDLGDNSFNGVPFDESIHVLRIAPCP